MDGLVLQLVQTLVWLHAQQLLGFVTITVHAVIPDSAELLVLGLALNLALGQSMEREADLVVLRVVNADITVDLGLTIEAVVQVVPGRTHGLFWLAISHLVAVDSAGR